MVKGLSSAAVAEDTASKKFYRIGQWLQNSGKIVAFIPGFRVRVQLLLKKTRQVKSFIGLTMALAQW